MHWIQMLAIYRDWSAIRENLCKHLLPGLLFSWIKTLHSCKATTESPCSWWGGWGGGWWGWSIRLFWNLSQSVICILGDLHLANWWLVTFTDFPAWELAQLGLIWRIAFSPAEPAFQFWYLPNYMIFPVLVPARTGNSRACFPEVRNRKGTEIGLISPTARVPQQQILDRRWICLKDQKQLKGD